MRRGSEEREGTRCEKKKKNVHRNNSFSLTYIFKSVVNPILIKRSETFLPNGL